MAANERFWPRRLKWRLRGAWMWPTFAVLTIVEGVLLHELPPTGFRIPDVVIGSILALFANIFLVGVIAPWLARRLVERDRQGGRGRERFPPEIYLDRTATVLLAVGAVGVLAAGLGNIRVSTAETDALKEAGDRTEAFVNAHADDEVKQRLDGANSARLGEGFFRVCVPRVDARKQYCLFVDTRRNTVRRDSDTRPNQQYVRSGS
ncbi:MAG: hypothetical protein QOJ29_5475 [Thermoleophilaceae bacterium]|nr:hypothetical protein [Thermoleophilaceae bacterium]